jgi:hypothetical protein
MIRWLVLASVISAFACGCPPKARVETFLLPDPSTGDGGLEPCGRVCPEGILDIIPGAEVLPDGGTACICGERTICDDSGSTL